MEKMRLHSLDEVKDDVLGKRGSARREAHERRVKDAVYAYHLGEAIRQARMEQNLTQEQLGEKIGVKKAQISRIERGYSITIPTMSKVFRCLGFSTASLDLGGGRKVVLW